MHLVGFIVRNSIYDLFPLRFPNIWRRVQLPSLPSSLYALPTAFHLVFIAPMTSGETYKLWRHSLCNFFVCLVTSLPLDPNILLNILFSDTLRWVHTCNVTAYYNTVSWQCWPDSCPRNVSKVGYAIRLRAFSVCCRYLVLASKGWYGYGLSRCGRATSRCTSTPAPAVTISSLWCDGQIPPAHRTSP